MGAAAIAMLKIAVIAGGMLSVSIAGCCGRSSGQRLVGHEARQGPTAAVRAGTQGHGENCGLESAVPRRAVALSDAEGPVQQQAPECRLRLHARCRGRTWAVQHTPQRHALVSRVAALPRTFRARTSAKMVAKG